MTRPHLLLLRPRSRARGLWWCERGSVSIQLVILMPAMFAVMFLGMQAALTYHARTLAIASAQEGARAAGARERHRRGGYQHRTGLPGRHRRRRPHLHHGHRHQNRHHRHRHRPRGGTERAARVAPGDHPVRVGHRREDHPVLRPAQQC